jgi:hypothetical protein
VSQSRVEEIETTFRVVSPDGTVRNLRGVVYRHIEPEQPPAPSLPEPVRPAVGDLVRVRVDRSILGHLEPRGRVLEIVEDKGGVLVQHEDGNGPLGWSFHEIEIEILPSAEAADSAEGGAE